MNLYSQLNVKSTKKNSKENIEFPITLPPLYHLFLNTFDLGKEQKYGEKYLNAKNEKEDFLGFYWSHTDGDIKIECLFNEEDLLTDIAHKDYEEMYQDLNIVRIGYTGYSGSVFIGVDANSNIDQIFINIDYIRLISCANNIFEFVSKVNANIDQKQIDTSKLNIDNLYKNWHEDFWRIKPPEFRDARPFELLDRDTLDRKYKNLKKSGADLSGIEYEYKVRGIELPKKFLFW